MPTDLLTRSRANKYPQSPQIKKRHWCLGSAVILIGSWITHTTTATISDGSMQRERALFEEIAESPVESAEAPAAIARSGALLADELALDESTLVPLAQATVPTEEPLRETRYKVRRGDTIGGIFKKLDLDLDLPYKISQHDTARQLVSLSIGRELVFKSSDAGLKELHYPVNKLQRMVVAFADDEIYNAEIADLPFEVERRTMAAEINSSLYEAALAEGLSNGMVMEMVRIFGWDIDFVQDIRAGDSFSLIYENYTLQGEKLADGDILAAEFTTQNRTYRAIRFVDADGNTSFYNPQGESMLGTFLRSPVEFSRISSRFGNRKHPISKKWRKHKGVDYAASRGTPIRATADGKVILAGRNGGYGKTVVLRHAGRFSTLYAHMNGYAKGIRNGTRVKQGDVIGYIGTTGYSTGPHLHYEFRVDGVHRNPLTYKTPKASAVKPEHRAAFAAVATPLAGELDQLGRSYQLARAGNAQSKNIKL